MNKPMTKQELLSYIEKTWDTAQREAWGETPRKGAGMTREEIIKLAREAGFSMHDGIITGGVTDLERFAALVAASEREQIIAKNAPVIEQINAHIKTLEDAVAAEHQRERDIIREALAEQPAQPYKGIADHTNQATNGRLKIDPVTGDVGIGTPIAKPVQQEPVAWRYLTQYESGASIWTYCAGEPANRETRQPLYTSPPVQRTWVGLTDEEIGYIIDDYSNVKSAIRAAELQLKEKNT